jgi:carboxyl-terminal processing protease
MHITAKQSIKRLVLLVLTLAVILSSLSSCFRLPGSQTADKDEVRENIAVSLADGKKNHGAVHEYLTGWGIPTFDRVKFSYFESIVTVYYNYEDAPETEAHAAALTEKFLDEYYDGLNLLDKAAVTDALLECYADTLGDPYAIYRVPEATDEYDTDMSGKFGGIGVMVEYNDLDESIMVSTVYPDSPAEKAGIKVGDYIHAVDGKTVEELGYLNAVNYVRGEIGTSVEITVLRGEELVTVTAIRGEVEELNVVYEIDDEKQIGYVQIVSFKENTFPQFKEAIDSLESAGVKGIIFDLRNNPGGYVDSVLSVISYLIPNDVPVMSYQYKGRDKIELKSKDQGEDHVVNLPFVVICNQYTASAGEIFTAAIRDYRNDKMLEAKIVGVTTYGKGIMQSSYYYPMDKSTVTFTVAYYNPPCEINYHGTGVTPDVIVEIENNTDTQYEAAVKELQNLISDN